jgi:hypothetical protein
MADDDDDTGVVDSKDHRGLVRRIETLSRRESELKAKLAAAEAKTTELQATIAEHGKAAKGWEKLQQERDQLLAERNSWADERAILSSGISDPEGIDMARLAYGRIPEGERPKGGLSEWLGDREKLPKGVQAYLPAPADAKPPAVKPPPNPNAGARPPPNGTQHGASQLGTMSVQDFATSREAIWQELGFTAPSLPGKQGT